MGRIEQIVEGRTDQTGCDEQNRQQRVERIRQDGKNRTDSRGQNVLDRMGRIEQIVQGRTDYTRWEEQNRQQRVERIRQDGTNRTDSRG